MLMVWMENLLDASFSSYSNSIMSFKTRGFFKSMILFLNHSFFIQYLVCDQFMYDKNS